MAKLKVTLMKSTIGRKKDHKALGLKKIRDEKIHEANPTILGMINKVDYMVKVEEL